MQEFEGRSHVALTDRFRGALQEEFGEVVVAACEPLSNGTRAAIMAKLDEPFETYRFLRVLCALERDGADGRRRLLVARIAGSQAQPCERLTRMERAASPSGLDPDWPSRLEAETSEGFRRR